MISVVYLVPWCMSPNHAKYPQLFQLMMVLVPYDIAIFYCVSNIFLFCYDFIPVKCLIFCTPIFNSNWIFAMWKDGISIQNINLQLCKLYSEVFFMSQCFGRAFYKFSCSPRRADVSYAYDVFHNIINAKDLVVQQVKFQIYTLKLNTIFWHCKTFRLLFNKCGNPWRDIFCWHIFSIFSISRDFVLTQENQLGVL